MQPQLSYTIWFTPRTGSTLLCKALELTGVAGKPREWLNVEEQNLIEFYEVRNHTELQKHLWKLGSTSNGVFGIKFGLYEPYFSKLLATFQKFPNCPQVEYPRAEIWQHAFPNSRHIFMARRNKVRLAVSWWKAIQTQEWYREQGNSSHHQNGTSEYRYEAIKHLYNECSMREAGTQEFFSEAGIVPLNIFYEDFIQEYEKTIRNVFAYLGLNEDKIKIHPPSYEKIADDISEEWVQRFRREHQQEWKNRGW